MRKFKKLFVFLLSLCCLFTNIMGSSLTTVSAATQVKVEIVGNGGTFDISGTGASMTGTGYQWHEETLDVGSTLAASNITITDPVSANGWTFNGWDIRDNTDPSNSASIITGLLSTTDMLNYTLPNHNVLIQACWDTSTGNGSGNSGGNQGNTQAEVMLYADGGDFGFTMPDGVGNATNWANFWVTPGNSLKDDNYTITDASKRGYIFKGWMECTYTIDSTTNMPICTPVAGTALRSTADVMNLTVPSTGIAFIAQYDVDTRTYVNVFFDGNGGTFTFDKNGYVQNGCEGYGNNYPAGSTVATEEPNLTFTNPVYWNSNRAFTGWMACVRVPHTDVNGNQWTTIEQIAGTNIMTTAEAFAYTIPNEELIFRAQYAGNDDDYNSQVYINGYGAPFTYEEYYWNNNQQQSATRLTEGWGSYLKEDGTSIATQCKDRFVFKDEPSKSGATFEGWMEFKVETKINKLGNEYEDYTLLSQTLLTTNDMLNRVVPSYDVAYVAKWSDMDFDDYYQWVNTSNVGFSAEPGRFYFEDPAHGITGEYFNGANWGYEKGETLASLGVVVKDPTATGYIFKGWKVCSVEFTQNGPVFTQLPNTSLITTTDALNHIIPDYNIFFVAEWEKDARPIVNVCFEGNDGEFEITYSQDKWTSTFYGNEYIVGTTVADAGISITDPVFWDKTRAFEGWEICKWVEHTDDEGNRWSELEQVAGTKILTTAEALTYTIPDYEIVFRAKWAGDNDDYYSHVFINGYGVAFDFEEGYWNEQNQQHEFRPMQTEVWGNSLREDGTTLAAQTQEYFKLTADPVKNGATFEGWLEFKVDITIDADGYWHEEYTLVNDTLYTTAQILAKKIPAYNVAYVAKWSDIPTEEYFADSRVLFLSANGGEITLDVVDENGNPITINTTASECWYLECDTVSEGLTRCDWKYVGIKKQCATLMGWTIYAFDSHSFVEMPAGQELNVGDPDTTFIYFDTYTDDNGNSYDRYLGMVNARMEFGYASTGQLMSFVGNKAGYFAIANWQETHTAAPFVQENEVKPVQNADGTYTDGSYDKVVYCADCHLELERETCAIKVEMQEVTIPGIEAPAQLEVRTGITEDEIPTALEEKGYTTVAEISEALEEKALESVTSLDKDKIQVEEIWVELKVYDENTQTWVEVDEDTFPEEGIEVVLPYPAGMSSSNCTYVITHMFDKGEKAGQIEVLTPTFMPDGIHVTVTGCSPFSIVYQEIVKTPVNNAPSPAPVESEHTLPNGTEVRMITVDGDSSVYVIGELNILPKGASFESENVTSGNVFNNIQNLITKKFGSADFRVFEMNLFNASNQKLSQLSGKINVTLPIPEGMLTREGESLVVYRVANGKLIKCDTAVANGHITFATDHFSTYVIVEVNAMTSPKTGDFNMMPMFTVLMLLAFAASTIALRKKVK